MTEGYYDVILHMCEWTGFNVVSQRFIAMYNSVCQICCNWSRLNPYF